MLCFNNYSEGARGVKLSDVQLEGIQSLLVDIEAFIHIFISFRFPIILSQVQIRMYIKGKLKTEMDKCYGMKINEKHH